jgi:hypothetical protein
MVFLGWTCQALVVAHPSSASYKIITILLLAFSAPCCVWT